MLGVLVLGSGCSTTTELEVTQKLSDSADAPYEKILVVSLFDSHDARRYLETEIVNALAKEGVSAVASTTMMDSTVPIVRQTFIDQIDEVGADALLLTQLTAVKANLQEQDASPQATYNYWPTYYWNVWGVELTEYVEPPRVLIDHTLVLATQAFSVAERDAVWALESKSEFVEIQEEGLDYNVFIDEANAIVKRLKRDGVVN
jgi:hypothetical protein